MEHMLKKTTYIEKILGDNLGDIFPSFAETP
jgi:hypothetical protein